MKILVVGEGPNDIGKDESEPRQGTLQQIVTRILENPEGLEFERHRVVHLGPRRTSHGFRDKLEFAFKEMSVRNCQALVFVVDSDDDLKRIERLVRARDEIAADNTIAVGTAIRKIEAWLLADEKAFALAFDCSTPNTSKSPEEIPEPKSVLREWLDEVDQWDYSGAYAQIASQVRVGHLAKRCPKGFAPFVTEVRRLALGLE